MKHKVYHFLIEMDINMTFPPQITFTDEFGTFIAQNAYYEWRFKASMD